MIDAMRRRRSVRAFLKKPVPAKKLKAILTAAMWSPNSWGTRPWEFVVVEDGKMLEAISRATNHAKFVKYAPLAIVVCYDEKKGRRFKEDSSICAEHMNLQAVEEGLSGCFVQIADAGDPAGSAELLVKKLLGIPDALRVLCVMPIGYARKTEKPHTQKEYDAKKVHFERFGASA